MFVENPVTGQLVVVLSLLTGEWYARFTFLLSLPFDWYGAVRVNADYALVAAVSDGFGVLSEVYP
jgi:hypothetical protein